MEVMMKKYLRLVLVVLPGIFLSNFLNSAVYYVATTGNDSTGNGSSSTPWKTLAYAVSHVPVVSGNTVHLNAGTFNETAQSVVPLGINIEGAGPTQTIINSSYAGILLSLQSSSISNGNQTISNLAIRGNNTVKEAIRVQKRNNVVMRELDIRDIAENGIILYGDDSSGYSTNLNIYNSSFSNISTHLPSGWYAFDQGAIRMHRIDGCEIKNVQITNTLSTQGGGIKFYLPNNPSVKNIKIHDCNIVSRYLDIELWTMSDGCEIYNNRFAGWLSLLGTGKGAKSYGLYVHDNIFSYSIENLYGGMGKYCIELSISDAIIENNYFENYPEGAIDMWEYSTHNNITIRNNIFYNLQWHAILVGVPSGFNTFKVYNNVFHSNKGSTPALRMRFASGGTLSNADIKNNIFMGDNLGNSVITREGTASLTNAVFSNNLTYQINTDLTEFAQSNNLLNTNPQIKATGSRRDTYYQLNSISPCIDAGTNVGLSYNGTAPDIGRWESSYSSNLINVKNYGATGNGSTNDATSIQNAINDCPTGGTVYFPNGTYLLNSTLTLPVQKSLQGESKTGTILKGNHTNHMITGINTTHVNGNQSVYNFTIDGNHKSIGLDFWGRDNLNFYNLSITHMENAGGALFVHSTDNANDPQCSREHPPLFYINNVNISSCTFSDNNGGSIGLLGIDGGNIHNNTHNERNGSTGTGLTCWAQGWLKNVKIRDSTFSCWRDIELMNMIGGNEIYNCNFTGWVSIPDGGLASGFTYSLAVHDNVFSYIAAGCDTQHHALEAGNSDMLIYNNYFENYEAGIQMFATAPFNDNITIRNNVFYNIGGLYTYLATIGLGAGSASENNRQNIKILNNTFHVSGAYSPIVISGGTSSPTLTNCEIKNNIFYGNNTGTSVISKNGTAFTYTNCSFTNNLTYNLNNNDFSGFTQAANKLSTDPLITGSGNKPTPYYTLRNISPCIDAGVNVGLLYNGNFPDIGRYEFVGTPPPSSDPLICNWHLNEGTGSSAGDSGLSGSTGTITGAVWVDGKIGKSLQFDGLNTYVSVADSNSLDLTSGISIEAWVKCADISQDGSTRRVLDKGAYLIGASDKAYFKILKGGVASEVLKTWTSADVNVWHHIVGAYDGAAMKLYQDGIKVAETATTGNIDTNTTALNIGRQPSGAGRFSGIIDEVKIYNRALTDAEVLSHYNPAPVDNPPIVAITAPANNATLTGTATISGTASDDNGVSAVALYIDNVVRSTDTAAPYTYAVDTTQLTNGTHTIKLIATDTANKTANAQISVTVNNVAVDNPPTVAITAPANNATVSASVTITATATDDNGVASISFYVDDVLKNTYTTSPYTYSLDTTGYANGVHTIKAVATDTIAQTANAQISVTVNNVAPVDNPPTVSITAPANNATISGTITITATATDDNGVASVGFYVDDILKNTDTTSPYTYALDTTLYTNAAHTIKVVATDTIAQTANAQISVTINNVAPVDNPPTVSITAPANGDTISGSIAITATASDDNGVSRVNFYIDNIMKSTDTASPYTYTMETTQYSNGSHIIKAVATDTASQTANTQITVTVNNVAADNPPTVSITAPANNATISGTITITATASDDNGVSSVRFYVDNIMKSTDTASPYTYNLDTTGYANGTHIIKAVATDTANQTANLQISVTVNNIVIDNPPTINITAPTNNSIVSGIVTISGTATDDNGVASVAFYIDNILKNTDTTSPYTYSLDTTGYINGVHTVKAVATDTITQTTNAQISVTINNVAPVDNPPTINITAPTNNSIVSGIVTISATASDDNGVNKVCFYVDNVIKSTDTISPYTYVLDSTGLSDGAHTIKAAVTGTNAPTTIAQITITIDNAPPSDDPPTVAITAPANGDTISGSIAITATASDDNGVSRVNFYVDNIMKSTDTASPYTYNLDTTGYANGTHIIKAVATDTANQTANLQITVTVSNIVIDNPPTINITAPTNNSMVSGIVTISGTATDDNGVASVAFYIDNILKNTDTTSPYTYSLNTTGYADGSHTIKAVATDTASQTVNAQ